MKIFRDGNTFIAPAGSYFEGNVKINGDFLVPPFTHFWGVLDVEGDLELGPNSSVKSRIRCKNAVIGSNTIISGPLKALGDVTICDSAKIETIEAAGDVILRPGVETGDVKSEGTIYVYGKVKSGKLFGRQVKVLRDPNLDPNPPEEYPPGQPPKDRSSSL
ncbi:MAG: polymer-forming cytoskeletal protein [Methanomicrobiaceae archaeon]|nr:polymer-forming cytoskeletal protein [Methanomicrobiaceae archaeon]